MDSLDDEVVRLFCARPLFLVEDRNPPLKEQPFVRPPRLFTQTSCGLSYSLHVLEARKALNRVVLVRKAPLGNPQKQFLFPFCCCVGTEC